MFLAILRLTKKSDQNPESENGQEVEFVDMLKEQEKETPDVGETEKLVLFLKHPYYAGIPAGQLSMVMENVIHLAEKKAGKNSAKTAMEVLEKGKADYLMMAKGNTHGGMADRVYMVPVYGISKFEF